MGTFDQILLTFKIQPKIEPHVQNFENSKFELFVLKIQKKVPFCSFETSGIIQDLKYNKLTIEPRICTKVLTTTACARFWNQMPKGDLNDKIPLAQNFEQAVFCRSNHPKINRKISFGNIWIALSDAMDAFPPKFGTWFLPYLNFHHDNSDVK